MVLSDRVRFYVVPTVFLLCTLPVLLALGTWQVQRLHWKQDLIENATERPKRPPVAAPGPAAWPDFDYDRTDYLPVAVSGRYAPGEVHVYTVLTTPQSGSHRGQGYWIMAPFVTADGWTAIVNRGFVPGPKKQPETRPEPETSASDGPIRLVGLVRRRPEPNSFTPENNLSANQWYRRDPVAIGAHFGVPADRLAPYSLDLVAAMTPSSGLPQAGETRMQFTNSHLQYAVTWYGLALTLIGVYAAFILGRLRAGKKA